MSLTALLRATLTGAGISPAWRNPTRMRELAWPDGGRRNAENEASMFAVNLHALQQWLIFQSQRVLPRHFFPRGPSQQNNDLQFRLEDRRQAASLVRGGIRVPSIQSPKPGFFENNCFHLDPVELNQMVVELAALLETATTQEDFFIPYLERFWR